MKTMSNREKYKKAFSVLHVSENTVFEPGKTRIPHFSATRKTITACFCAAVMISLSVAAYAYGEQIVREVLGWGGNMKMAETINGESGEIEKSVLVMTSSLTEPVQIEDRKLFFIVNNEHIDITDSVSESEPYVYEYTDKDGYIHYWIIGLNGPDPEHYGYGEYIKDSDNNWIAGYSARTDLDPDQKGPEWLSLGKQMIGGDCPW